MFSLINDFLNDFDFKTKTATNLKAFKYVNFNNEIFYLQNFKDIISFCEDEIVVKLYSGDIKILGKNLKIKEISHKYICIYGKIEILQVNNV